MENQNSVDFYALLVCGVTEVPKDKWFYRDYALMYWHLRSCGLDADRIRTASALSLDSLLSPQRPSLSFGEKKGTVIWNENTVRFQESHVGQDSVLDYVLDALNTGGKSLGFTIKKTDVFLVFVFAHGHPCGAVKLGSSSIRTRKFKLAIENASCLSKFALYVGSCFSAVHAQPRDESETMRMISTAATSNAYSLLSSASGEIYGGSFAAMINDDLQDLSQLIPSHLSSVQKRLEVCEPKQEAILAYTKDLEFEDISVFFSSTRNIAASGPTAQVSWEFSCSALPIEPLNHVPLICRLFNYRKDLTAGSIAIRDKNSPSSPKGKRRRIATGRIIEKGIHDYLLETPLPFTLHLPEIPWASTESSEVNNKSWSSSDVEIHYTLRDMKLGKQIMPNDDSILIRKCMIVAWAEIASVMLYSGHVSKETLLLIFRPNPLPIITEWNYVEEELELIEDTFWDLATGTSAYYLNYPAYGLILAKKRGLQIDQLRAALSKVKTLWLMSEEGNGPSRPSINPSIIATGSSSGQKSS